jgi:hypothetical protein
MLRKTLFASAYAAVLARRAADYGGVLDGAARIDMKKVNSLNDKLFSRNY